MTPVKLKIQSDFFYLDVKRGRVTLADLVESGVTPDVTITGKVIGMASHDDGVSIGFECQVDSAIVRWHEPT